jgi:hypothetical protein
LMNEGTEIVRPLWIHEKIAMPVNGSARTPYKDTYPPCWMINEGTEIVNPLGIHEKIAKPVNGSARTPYKGTYPPCSVITNDTRFHISWNPVVICNWNVVTQHYGDPTTSHTFQNFQSTW